MESCSIIEAKQTEALKEKVILIGNPNVGKSVIFNYLTGKYVTVSNYPGTTVEVSTGTLSAHGKKFQVLDTPGVNSLIPMSEDEKVTRDILLKEPQSYLIQVIDTKNIRRGLLISLQLFEMGLPFIVVVAVALLSAVPTLSVGGPRRPRVALLAGAPPPVFSCRFAGRCPQAMAVCRQREPALVEIAPGHAAACFLHSEASIPAGQEVRG